MPCRCRHGRARRDCAHRRYALPCLAVAVPAVIVPTVVVPCYDRANGIAVAIAVIAVLY